MKKIDKNFIIAFKEGAKDYKNEIFNRDNFDNLSEEGKAFMEPVLKELDQDRLSEVWGNHCNSPTVADEKKLMNIERNLRDFITQGEALIIYSPKRLPCISKGNFQGNV